jgi:hypothetical protein
MALIAYICTRMNWLDSKIMVNASQNTRPGVELVSFAFKEKISGGESSYF